jgi:hypothetical protein
MTGAGAEVVDREGEQFVITKPVESDGQRQTTVAT